MRIHNIFEEVVLDKIEEILVDLSVTQSANKIQLAKECILDIACYVLNRLPPLYIVSGRGLAYFDLDYLDKLQRDADLVTLIHQGIERITEIRRPYYKEKKDALISDRENFYYNFPILRGRVFNSLNFEPLYNIEVELLYNKKKVEMFETTWQNPYKIVANTPGFFYFWPKPEIAPDPTKPLEREFEIAIHANGFEELRHFVPLQIKAEKGVIDYFRINKIISLKDLYLLPLESN